MAVVHLTVGNMVNSWICEIRGLVNGVTEAFILLQYEYY
jgi:hypothetical protein